MTPQPTENETIILGQFLRETRIKLGHELEDVSANTRISVKTLQVIETSDFANLPAEVFSRGFYALYAKYLRLDPDHILHLYDIERKFLPTESPYKTPPPNRLAENMKSLADRPSKLPFPCFGLSLLMVLLFGAFLCWLFSWNPASYLSFKLRSLETTPQAQMSKQKNHTASIGHSVPPAIEEQKSYPEKAPILTTNVAIAATQPSIRQEPPISQGPPKYFVNAVFRESTKVILTIDDAEQQTQIFKKGEQVNWQAVNRLVLSLPSKTKTKITVNQVPLRLPKTSSESLIISIPE